MLDKIEEFRKQIWKELLYVGKEKKVVQKE